MYRQRIIIFTASQAGMLEVSVNNWLAENTSDGRCIVLKMMQTESNDRLTITIYYNEHVNETV